MRRRGPGLMRTVGRTAVIAGTATAVSGRVAHRQQQRYETQEVAQQQEMYQPVNQPVAEPALDYTAELNELARLKAQGVITEEEFQAKKRQILGI
jgi:putative oligomerization/nucleic acid binding protein